MFQKEVVVDCRGHLLGRLASIIAKELLNGQHVVCVRTDEINISGSLFRNRLKYEDFRRKRTNTNPTHGPFHFKAPFKILWRVIRGMVPHKNQRGAAALDRLKAFEGMPAPYDTTKKVVIPQAMKVLRLKTGRKFCQLGDLAASIGWNSQSIVADLEDKRRARSAKFFEEKQKIDEVRKTITKA